MTELEPQNILYSSGCTTTTTPTSATQVWHTWIPSIQLAMNTTDCTIRDTRDNGQGVFTRQATWFWFIVCKFRHSGTSQ